MEPSGQRPRGLRRGGSSRQLCDRASRPGPATLVRGSSRRITFTKAGFARSILEYQGEKPSRTPPGRWPVGSRSKKNHEETEEMPHQLDGSFHIRCRGSRPRPPAGSASHCLRVSGPASGIAPATARTKMVWLQPKIVAAGTFGPWSSGGGEEDEIVSSSLRFKRVGMLFAIMARAQHRAASQSFWSLLSPT